MFWKKKQMTTAPVIEGAATVKEATPQKKAVSPKIEKLPGPRSVPDLAEKYLVSNCKLNIDMVRILRSVLHRRPGTERASDCRIFDQSEAEAKEVIVKDYTSLDGHPELILYEGWLDEDAKRVELTEKRKMNYDVPLFTEAEILQKIEALNEPGSTVFFYQARGPAFGGPLGRGAAVVELNPNYPGKKQKKYNLYTTNVFGMEPLAQKQKLFALDKAKDIAKWVKDAHHKRMY